MPDAKVIPALPNHPLFNIPRPDGYDPTMHFRWALPTAGNPAKPTLQQCWVSLTEEQTVLWLDVPTVVLGP
jgi:hypothetical protein